MSAGKARDLNAAGGAARCFQHRQAPLRRFLRLATPLVLAVVVFLRRFFKRLAGAKNSCFQKKFKIF